MVFESDPYFEILDKIGLLAIIGEQNQTRSYVGNRVKVNSSQFQVLQNTDDEIEIEIIQKSGNVLVGYIVQSKQPIKILKFSENSVKKKSRKSSFELSDRKLKDLCAQLVMKKFQHPRFKKSPRGARLIPPTQSDKRTIVDHYLEYLIARVKIELLKNSKINCLQQMLNLEASNPSGRFSILWTHTVCGILK